MGTQYGASGDVAVADDEATAEIEATGAAACMGRPICRMGMIQMPKMMMKYER